MQIENLDQADACRAIHSPNDCGIAAGWQRSNDDRFAIIGWREPGSSDFQLLRIFPIIAGRDDIAIRVVQRQGRIKQRACGLLSVYFY